VGARRGHRRALPDFGENGMVDLRVGMGDYQNEFIPAIIA
jgi:hypothetical protein